MSHKYQPVEQKDEPRQSDEESSPDTEALLPATTGKRRLALPRSNLLCLCLHLLLTLGLLVGLRLQESLQRQPTCPKLLPMELPWAEPYIEYETRVLQPSGFGRLFNITGPVTEYEGPPTPEIDARWHNLSRVGIYSLTPSQNEDFFSHPPQTLTADSPYGAPNTPIVQIEVFHQLHCLNFLRKLIYHPDTPPVDPGGPASIAIHTDHCVDYLRQVLTCHGDVTPITHFVHETTMRSFWPNFTVPHTCRKWDRLVEWAELGSTTGLTIE